jgi:hypothetical protein
VVIVSQRRVVDIRSSSNLLMKSDRSLASKPRIPVLAVIVARPGEDDTIIEERMRVVRYLA